jgi:hypothetical protein
MTLSGFSLDLFFSGFSKKFSPHGFLTEQFTERDQTPEQCWLSSRARSKHRRDPTASHADGAGRGGERRWLRGAESLADYRIHLGL